MSKVEFLYSSIHSISSIGSDSLFTSQSLFWYSLFYFLLLVIWYKPVLVLYHSLRAGHMLKKKKYTQVSEHYFKIAQIKKKEGYGDYAKGLAYYYQKDFKEARSSLESALAKGIRSQKKSSVPITKLALLTVYMELKKWHSASQLLQELEADVSNKKKVFPNKLLAIFLPIKGEYLYYQNMKEEAFLAFQEGYAKYPDLMGEEAFIYAKILSERGERNQAISILTNLLSLENEWKFFRMNKREAKLLLENIS
jgi:tetratricopeptide (TPR) repeat protein